MDSKSDAVLESFRKKCEDSVEKLTTNIQNEMYNFNTERRKIEDRIKYLEGLSAERDFEEIDGGRRRKTGRRKTGRRKTRRRNNLFKF